MKKMKNGQSVLENLVELLVDLDELSREEFLKFARRKSGRSDKKYVQLFKHLRVLVVSGIGVEEIEGADIKGWSEETGLTANFNDLVRELYEKVLLFLGEQYKKQDEEKWKQEIEQGLYAVQALIERRLNSQAGILMDKLEKKIPKQPDRKYWRDFSVLVKLAYLRIQVASKTDFVKATEEDKFLSQIHENCIPHGHNADVYKGGEKVFERYSDQLFFVKIYQDSISKNGDWRKEKETIRSIIDSVPERTKNSGKYNFKKIDRFFSESPEHYFESIFWNLYAYGRALEYGMYDDALNYLSKLNSHNQPEDAKNLMELSVAAWMGYITGELNLIKIWKGSQPPEGEQDFDKYVPFHFKLRQYTADLIQYLPHRLEINRILLLMYQGEYDLAHTVTAKMYQIDGLPISISYRLKIMEIWNWMLQGHRDTSDRAKSVYNHFKNKEDYKFEKAVASILNKCSINPKSFWKEQIEEKCKKDHEAMEKYANPRDPLHQFFLIWVGDVLSGSYKRR